MVTAPPGLLVVALVVGMGLTGGTALRLHRDHRLAGAPALGHLTAGFGLLSVAQAAAAIMELLTLGGRAAARPDALGVLDVLFWAYYASMLTGLAFIFRSFGRRPFAWAPVLTPIVLVVGPLLQFVVLVFLFFVVLHAGLNHIARARPGSLQTAAGFFLLLLGQFVSLFGYAPLNPRTVAGEAVTLVGYLLLFLAVARPRGAA